MVHSNAELKFGIKLSIYRISSIGENIMSTWNQCNGPNKIIKNKIAGLKNRKNQAQTQVLFRKDESHNTGMYINVGRVFGFQC